MLYFATALRALLPKHVQDLELEMGGVSRAGSGHWEVLGWRGWPTNEFVMYRLDDPSSRNTSKELVGAGAQTGKNRAKNEVPAGAVE